jgi:hypothetical protein
VSGGAAQAGSESATGGRGACADRALLFCEDFERQPTGGPATLAWGVDTSHGTLTVQRQRSGKVLHVHTEGNGRAFLKVEDFAAPGNSYDLWIDDIALGSSRVGCRR